MQYSLHLQVIKIRIRINSSNENSNWDSRVFQGQAEDDRDIYLKQKTAFKIQNIMAGIH